MDDTINQDLNNNKYDFAELTPTSLPKDIIGASSRKQPRIEIPKPITPETPHQTFLNHVANSETTNSSTITKQHSEQAALQQLDTFKEEMKPFNRIWKINPSEVADFYLLEPLIFRTATHYSHDKENIALLRAKSTIQHIGNRVGLATFRAALQEHKTYSSFPDIYMNTWDIRNFKSFAEKTDPTLMSRLVPTYLTAATTKYRQILEDGKMNPSVFKSAGVTAEEVALHLQEYESYLAEITANPNMESIDFKPEIAFNAVRYHMRDMRKRFDEYDQRGEEPTSILADKQKLFDALTIMEQTQKAEDWKTTAKYMKALFFPDTKSTVVPDDMESSRRNVYLVDRLLNQVHSTGTLLEYITNDYPQMCLVMTLHGMRGDQKHALWQYASNGVRQELSGRSKLLLGDQQLPALDNQLSAEEKRALVDTVSSHLLNPTQNRVVYGILAEYTDPTMRTELLRLLKQSSNREEILNDLYKEESGQIQSSVRPLIYKSPINISMQPNEEWRILLPITDQTLLQRQKAA